MKTYAFRLHRGDDLRLALTRFARENHLRGAVVLSCVGCLSHWRLRDASGVNMQEKTEQVEIVSATIGGHLAEGCIVNTTAEIVLLELEDVAFGAAYDADTGYDEITIQPL